MKPTSDWSHSYLYFSLLQAGIEKSSLTIALEPEAASIHCQYLPAKNLNLSTSKYLGELAVGTKYLVADLGGLYIWDSCAQSVLDFILHAHRVVGSCTNVALSFF